MTKILEQIQARASARYALPALILGAAGFTLSGCPGGAALENAEEHLEVGPGEVCDAKPIFETKCGGGSCHSNKMDGSPPGGGVNLVDPGVEARLLNVPATYPTLTGCPEPPELLVNSADVDSSLMWTKVSNTQACGDGMPYPHSLSKLNGPDMDCVYSWLQGLVAGGAPGAGGTTGTGGDSSGTGGDTGAGGTTGTGGDEGGTGGAGGQATPIRVQAECALATGDCATTTAASATGPAVDRPMLEASNMQVGYIITGVTMTYEGIMTSGHDSITLQYAKLGSGGTLEIRQGSAAGTLLGTATPAETGAWDTYMPMTVSLSQPLTGPQTIVLVALGSEAGVLNLDWFELTGSAE
jgi:hypothetical protein